MRFYCMYVSLYIGFVGGAGVFSDFGVCCLARLFGALLLLSLRRHFVLTRSAFAFSGCSASVYECSGSDDTSLIARALCQYYLKKQMKLLPSFGVRTHSLFCYVFRKVYLGMYPILHTCSYVGCVV